MSNLWKFVSLFLLSTNLCASEGTEYAQNNDQTIPELENTSYQRTFKKHESPARRFVDTNGNVMRCEHMFILKNIIENTAYYTPIGFQI